MQVQASKKEREEKKVAEIMEVLKAIDSKEGRRGCVLREMLSPPLACFLLIKEVEKTG